MSLINKMLSKLVIFLLISWKFKMPKTYYNSCCLSTATIEYSCPSACLRVCVDDNSKNNGSVHLKLEHVV